MATSLFLTAGSTMFLKNKAARRLHIGAGIALIGFSLWHTSLYPKEKKIHKEAGKILKFHIPFIFLCYDFNQLKNKVLICFG